MKRCAFLTMQSLDAFVCDDELARAPLGDLGWSVEFVNWQDRKQNWRGFDLVVIRSTWDYQSDPDRFLATLENIERAPAPLCNPVQTVRWNLRKSYLADLRDRGVPIVPTSFQTEVAGPKIEALFGRFGVTELVLKPLVGANADHAFRVRPEQLEDLLPRLRDAYGSGGFLAQPFLPAVVAEGEFSLFYFGGELSHVILKTPKAEDFRVQEEHGGRIVRVHPEPSLVEAGDRIIASLPEALLYARADLVRTGPGRYSVMELELIEPSLYLRTDPGAPRRFAAALDRWHQRLRLE